MNQFRKILVVAVALFGSLAGFAASPASAVTSQTRPTCTATAGDPVVQVVNGVRYLQSFSSVRCTGPVSSIRATGGLPNSAYAVVKSGYIANTNTSSATFFIRVPCRTVTNNTYRTYYFPNVTFADGSQWSPSLTSAWNLRSCGV